MIGFVCDTAIGFGQSERRRGGRICDRVVIHFALVDGLQRDSCSARPSLLGGAQVAPSDAMPDLCRFEHFLWRLGSGE
jgi:hypothetical protein